MVRIFVFSMFLLLWSCKKTTISADDLKYLNGYWEIAEVGFPDGSKKQYAVNPSIDFIHLENKKGFRKKVQPNFDGSYNASNDAELLFVETSEGGFILKYSNDFSEWEEKLVHLDSTSFSVINQETIHYTYKRFQPIAIPK
ncbi:hypothetical protein [Flagellimonas meishanensis]|uniref:hypothetical protein n=1 Tax=Flagellimonas meishanensis TaxID=2873264 RepID=UPI001CA75133|nr:hypothetical protein [[Muricauda] meishanensis]